MTRYRNLGAICFITLMLGCSQPGSLDLLKELAQNEKNNRITIGWLYQQKELNLVVFDSKPLIRKYELSDTEATDVLASRPPQMKSDSGADTARSPDGRWIVYKSSRGTHMITDADRKTESPLVDDKRALTALAWSPDSKYLMWVEKGGTWDKEGLRCFDDTFHIEVYRVRDGSRASVAAFCQGYPPGGFQWLRIPSRLPLN